MRKSLFILSILFLQLTAFAQTSADYNYTIGIRAFTIMQMPKVLDQTNSQNYAKVFGHGAMFKFNDNQISYRLAGNYYRDDLTFDNTCATCEIASGKVTDYSFKIGFEKSFNYTKIQPYFAFDLGYRYNRFTGSLASKNIMANNIGKTTDASKSGLVVSPVIGFKLNVLPQLSIFAESSLDFFFSYEKQDITQMNGASRDVTTYKKLESLLNPVSAGIQFSLSNKN